MIASVKVRAAERAAVQETAVEPKAPALPKLTRGGRQPVVNIAKNLMTPVNGAEPRSLDEAGRVWRDCLDQGRRPSSPRACRGWSSA